MKLEKLVKQIDPKSKPAHPYCKQFRFTCWLPHPQPNCEDCKYYNGLKEARQ